MVEHWYVSLAAWPQDVDHDGRSALVAEALGLDRFTSGQLARRTAPTMLRRTGADDGLSAVDSLRGAGCAVGLVPGHAIREVLQRPLVMRLSWDGASGVLDARLRDGASVSWRLADLTLLVRAHPRERTGRDLGGGAGHHLQGTLGAEAWVGSHVAGGGLKVAEVLDIHHASGAAIRLLGGRFECAGVAPEQTPARQVDAVADAIAAAREDLTVDRGFERAAFLAEFAQEIGGGGDWRGDTGFSVYSAWLGLMRLAALEG